KLINYKPKTGGQLLQFELSNCLPVFLKQVSMKKNLLSISLVLVSGVWAFAQAPRYVRPGSQVMNVRDYRTGEKPAAVQSTSVSKPKPAAVRHVNPNQTSTVC